MRVPAVASRLLSALLPESTAEFVMGDLEEEFLARAARHGERAARRRYWRQTIALLILRPGRRLHTPTLPVRAGDSSMRQFIGDIRLAFRMLARQPGVTVAAVATLAIGLGATTAVFSVADVLLLRPLPFPHANRIVSVSETNAERGFSGNVSVPNFDDWRVHVKEIEAAAAFTASEANLAGADGSERVSAALVTSGFFDVVGTPPIAGTLFAEEARVPGADNVVVLSEGAWTRLFGRQADAIGRTAVLDGVPQVVVGVVPAVAGLEQIEVWRPLARTGPATSRSNHGYRAYVRLRDGVSIPDAERAFNAVAARLEADFPESNRGWRVHLTPLQDELTSGLDRTVMLVGAIVTLLLLITCANVAGLLLSRAPLRRREFAVRAALGAGRWRMVRQLLTESVLLSGLGAAAGLLVAWLSTETLATVLVPDGGLWRVPSLSGTVLLFAAGVAVATGVLFGLAPAFASFTRRPQDHLWSAQATASLGGRRASRALVFVQITLASVLLVASALLVTTLVRAINVNPGFDSANVQTFRISLPPASYADEPSLETFFDALGSRLAAFPQVVAVGATSNLPMGGSSTMRGVIRKGEAAPAPDQERLALYQVSTPGYVRALGMELIQGRDFSASDTRHSQPVALINESLARQLWPDGGALGREILVHTDEKTPRQVVGILKDIRYRGLARAVLPQYYVPFDQAPRRTMSVAIRATTPLPLADVRRSVAGLDAALPIYQVRALDDLVLQSTAERRSLTTAVALFGVIAVLLAGIGLQGVVATGVRERRREIGIRIAVGAEAQSIRWLFLRQGLVVAAPAVVAGLLASYWIVRLSRNALFDLAAPSLALLAGVAGLVLAVAAVASFLPARQATRVNPVETLRTD